MAGKQIDFPPLQKENSRVAPFMLGLSILCIEGNVRRAIDFHEGDKIDEKALKALIRAAVALNISLRATAPTSTRPCSR